MTVSFSWQLSAEQARRVALIAPDGKRRSPKLGHEQEVSSVSFDGPFAESAHYTVEVPHDIVDETGRTLANPSQFPLAVRTDEFPPLAKFSARFGIIEQADPVLPLTVRNLEPEIHGAQLDLHGPATVSGSKLYDLLSHIEATYWRVPPPSAGTVMTWMQRVAAANRDQSVFGAGPGAGAKTFTLPKPHGAKAFEVMGIPLKEPGLYIVELSSAKLGSVLLGGNRRMYVPTMALVTDLAVHFKQGNDNSLVWLTTLEKAQPVDGAAVTVADCNGAELWSGRTDHRGIALVPKLAAFDNLPDCSGQTNVNTDRNPDYYSTQNDALRSSGRELIVTASYGADFSFDRTGWQNGIETFPFNLPTEWQPTNVAATTVLDRTLFRAGETVHMKHFLRAKTIAGFNMLPPEKLPDAMRINLVGGDDTYDFKLAWRDNGTAESTWDIPKAAKLGSYSITLVRHNNSGASATPAGDQGAGGDTTEYPAGSFGVEEFRVPLMKAAIRLPPAPMVRATTIPVDVSVAYLSGGPAKGLPVTLRSQITNNATPAFPDLDRFTFANGPVKEGVIKSEEWEETGAQPAPGVHQRTALVLDGAGGARTQITDIPPAQTPMSVQAELEYRDPTARRRPFPTRSRYGRRSCWWGSTAANGRPRAAFAFTSRSWTSAASPRPAPRSR
jgi:alpha-2-macroglobulin